MVMGIFFAVGVGLGKMGEWEIAEWFFQAASGGAGAKLATHQGRELNKVHNQAFVQIHGFV